MRGKLLVLLVVLIATGCASRSITGLHWARPGPVSERPSDASYNAVRAPEDRATRITDVQPNERPTDPDSMARESASATLDPSPTHAGTRSDRPSLFALLGALRMEDAPERPGLDHRSTSPSTPSATLPNVDSTEQRDFNYLALVAFIASASALLTVSFAPGSFVVLLAIGLLLGIAALVQCIVRKDRGMGFAIAAILIPLSFIFLLLLYASGGYLH